MHNKHLMKHLHDSLARTAKMYHFMSTGIALTPGRYFR